MSRTYCLLIAWLVASYAAEAAAMPLEWRSWLLIAPGGGNPVGVFIGWPDFEPFEVLFVCVGFIVSLFENSLHEILTELVSALGVNAMTFLVVAPSVYIVIRRYFGYDEPEYERKLIYQAPSPIEPPVTADPANYPSRWG